MLDVEDEDDLDMTTCHIEPRALLSLYSFDIFHACWGAHMSSLGSSAKNLQDHTSFNYSFCVPSHDVAGASHANVGNKAHDRTPGTNPLLNPWNHALVCVGDLVC